MHKNEYLVLSVNVRTRGDWRRICKCTKIHVIVARRWRGASPRKQVKRGMVVLLEVTVILTALLPFGWGEFLPDVATTGKMSLS